MNISTILSWTQRAPALALALFLLSSPRLAAHVGQHPSVHDTVAGIRDRMAKELTIDQLRAVTEEKAEAMLRPNERQILATEHVSFRVTVPVKISIVGHANPAREVFWLKDQRFVKTELELKTSEQSYQVWQKDFPAGWIGLGVNSLSGGGAHYFVTVAPLDPADRVEIHDLYPGQLRLDLMKTGAKPYVDRSDALGEIPAALRDQILVRTISDRKSDANLIDYFRITSHPSSRRPDQITLTWSGDPKTTQTIQWRTSPEIKKGLLSYQKKAGFHQFRPKGFKTVRAKSVQLHTPNVPNDPVNYRHTVHLTGLEPATTYVYSVGNGKRDGWSELSEFTTAPDRVVPFTFNYMGDAQNGLDRWGSLLKNAHRERPDAAFYLMAGDLVNRGAERDDWDSFFYNAAGIYDRRTLVPVIGNHECHGGHPTLYLRMFDLPKNGPAQLEPERAYSFEYSNALFVILDSNLPPKDQVAWLDQRLAQSKATWKFVSYHHPAYSSAPKRDNEEIRELWGAVFDKYHVDFALQGHDHAYLRTYPMKGNQRVPSPKEGTIYIVSVSGTKMYDQDPRDYTEFGMTNVSTYQILDIQIEGDRLVYRAYDIDGNLRDQLVIQK